jgi:hypothetical protein
MDVSIWKKEEDNTCSQQHVSGHSGALYHLPPSVPLTTTQFHDNHIPFIMSATRIPNYEQFHHCFQCPHLQLRASMMNKTRRTILVYDQPTQSQDLVQISLNQPFVLNDDHRYLWHMTGIDRSHTNQDYVMFMAQGLNNRGWTRVVILQEWTTVKGQEEETYRG